MSKTPNEQAWWDKTWKPFKQHIRAWPRENTEPQSCIGFKKNKLITKIARLNKRKKSRKQIQDFFNELQRDN